MMGQMSFFLELQISQSPRGIFLNQSKYATEIIKKYGLLTSDSIDTPMVEKNKLDEDLQGTPIDATLYRGMIGSFMYLTSSRLDLIYAVCLCARYEAKPTEKHLNAVALADSSSLSRHTLLSPGALTRALDRTSVLEGYIYVSNSIFRRRSRGMVWSRSKCIVLGVLNS
ncbi:hypothetical protein Tco_0728864 [Tanacetum coccineum]|uniref:Reverse transcriptase Ty1/copia-type domain-containing protein n=1 Tax=Tanacetum coccineum TaxID=301880 RepID=A0ABQ4YQT2_9ASTR